MHPTHFNKVLAGANSGEVTAAARSKPQGHHWRLGSPCGAFKTCSSSRTHFVVMHCSIVIIFRYFYSWFIDAVDMASHALQLSQPGCRNTGRSLGGASLAPSGLRSGLMPPHPPSLTVISGSGVAAVGAGIGVGTLTSGLDELKRTAGVLASSTAAAQRRPIDDALNNNYCMVNNTAHHTDTWIQNQQATHQRNEHMVCLHACHEWCHVTIHRSNYLLSEPL